MRSPGGITLLPSLAAIFPILLGTWAGTEYFAWQLDFTPELGIPLTDIYGFMIYEPWKLFQWDYVYGAYVPSILERSYLLIYCGVFVGVVFALLISVIQSKRRVRPTTYGSARWATKNEILASGLCSGKGVVLGKDIDGHYLRHDGPEHVKVIAPTRSGKGVGVVVPTLLTWGESVLVYDLKSENWNLTAGYRNTFSQVIYFNPNDPASARFNPLSEVRLGELEVRDVQNVADMIVDPDGKGMSDHWVKTGHSLLVGTILHVLYSEKEKTLAGVAGFLSNPERTIIETLEAMMHAHHANGCTHPVVAAAARDMLNKSENERSGVLSTAMSFLALYRDPIVAANTSKSDFRITDLMQADRPLSLYLVIPPSDINRLRPLFRLIINQICRRLTEELNPSNNRRRLLLLLDEFPALGRLDFFESALGVIAGYGIKAMLISQSSNQLEKIYGARNSILDNTHVRVFYAPNTVETAEIISRMLGQKTEIHQQRNYGGNRLSPWLGHVMVADQESARALLTPAEVMELAKTDSLVFVAGYPPVRAKKLRFFEDENCSRRVLPPPNLLPKVTDSSATLPNESFVEKASAPEQLEEMKAFTD